MLKLWAIILLLVPSLAAGRYPVLDSCPMLHARKAPEPKSQDQQSHDHQSQDRQSQDHGCCKKHDSHSRDSEPHRWQCSLSICCAGVLFAADRSDESIAPAMLESNDQTYVHVPDSRTVRPPVPPPRSL